MTLVNPDPDVFDQQSQDLEPKYPDIVVQLEDTRDPAEILGRTRLALRKAGVSSEEINAFQAEALSGDHDTFMSACSRWVSYSVL